MVAKSGKDHHGYRHGRSYSRLYLRFRAMHDRCENPKSDSFKSYGARGIKVCERWKDFRNFLADMGESTPGMMIDRINNDGDYEPGNCRWITRKQQMNNMSSNRYLTVDGITKTLSQWGEETGLRSLLIRSRLEAGWRPEDAISLRPDMHRRYIQWKRIGEKI